MKRLKHGFRGISYHDNLLTPVSNLDTLPQLNLSIHIHHECFTVATTLILFPCIAQDMTKSE